MCIVRKVSDPETVPEETRVCDYDELPPAAQASLPELIESGAPRDGHRAAEDFDGCDVVKYTDYYEISPR